MNQIKNQFDPITLGKIKKSLLITLAGIALTSGALLGGEVLDWMATGAAIDWKTPLLVALSALGAFAYNTIKEWLEGLEGQEI